jgi:hypothetical protein
MSTTTIDAEVVTEAEAKAKQPLILKGSGYGLEIGTSYLKQKAEILKHAALIVTINDPAADAAADNQIKKLAAMRIETEKARETVKRPALDFGKKVDATAKEFISAITDEENRLKKLRGGYGEAVLAERQRVLKEQEAQRQAEEKARLEVEAKEAARIEAARQAEEAARIAREAAEQAAWEAVSPEEEEEAKSKADEAQRIADEAAEAEKERLRIPAEEAARVAALPVAAPVFVPQAVKGVKMVPEFEVLDLDALYKNNPQLVTLTERRKEILDFIAAHKAPGDSEDTLPMVPGLRVFLKPQVR